MCTPSRSELQVDRAAAARRSCMRLWIGLAVLVLAGCGSAQPTAALGPLEQPSVAVGPVTAAKTGGGYRVALVMTNPTDAPLRLTGYDPDSFDPPIDPDAIFPLYRKQRWNASAWNDVDEGFCGTGVTELTIPPRSARRLHVDLAPEDTRVRLGVLYRAADRERIAWSGAIPVQAP